MNLLQIEGITYFLLALPLVAFLYASIGHGGASGYLALMTLFSFAPEQMKTTALLLNLFVAGISSYHFYQAGFFNKKLFLSFSLSSVPFAFLGGTWEISPSIYKQVLAVLLLFAILRLLGLFGKEKQELKSIKLPMALLFGGLIGFFSGLIGIGGGIILSPFILLMRWGNIKTAAAVSSLFIWVNSAAGLLGQVSKGTRIEADVFFLVVIALIGGFLGSYWGCRLQNKILLKRLLVFVLFLASLKLFFI